MATDASVPTAWHAIPLAQRLVWANRHMKRTTAAGAALPPMHGYGWLRRCTST